MLHLLTTAYVLCAMCRFSDAGNNDLTTRSGGRRPKSAKARNRVGRWRAGRAARGWCGEPVMGIWARDWGWRNENEAGAKMVCPRSEHEQAGAKKRAVRSLE